MEQATVDSGGINARAQALLRLVIGSYFLAVALQLIPGTDLGILFSGVMPAPYDGALATGIVFALAFLVMVGHATRVAALVMALLTFYASYLTMLSLGVADELGSFWRDLALIAALLLTYSEPRGDKAPQAEAQRAIEALLSVTPRRVRPLTEAEAATRARRPAPALDFATLQARATLVMAEGPVAPRRTHSARAAAMEALAAWRDRDIDNIFAEEVEGATVPVQRGMLRS